ncbi:hypothetical protein [Bdellovibrio sp. GT3]|uniref:hypothetical protein n=1 Tax=Bdellovibrio sp. GT3 TaxID=3136282 RepID=UPI0030F21E70
MIHATNGELQAEKFTLKSSYSSEITSHFATLDYAERDAALSSLIEVGWVSIKVGQNRGDFDYWERLTKEWIEGLSTNLIGSNEELLRDFKEDITLNILEFKNKVQQTETAKDAAAAIAGMTTLKGGTFEEETLAVLSNLASLRNGEVESVGLVPGLTGGKKGDFIYRDELSRGLIAIEAKDLTGKISPAKIEEIMVESLQNRGASAGIFVVRNQTCLPDYFKNFHVGKKHITCTLEHLPIAISVARLLIPQTVSVGKHEEVAEFIEAVRSEIDTINEIIKATNSSRKSLGKAIMLSQGLKENLTMKIETFTTELQNEK